MAITGLHHIGVYVKDIEASTAFYTDKLGFTLDKALTLGTTKIAFVRLGTCIIELICSEEYIRRGEGQVTHICMQVDDIAETFKDLQAKGITTFETESFSALPAFGEKAANLFFRGPDDERLELFQ